VIPADFIAEWRAHTRWATDEQVEQDLVLSRALFQRKKGRDLFDLVIALEAGVDPAAVVEMFLAYVKADGREITRANFEEDLDGKLRMPAFTDDVPMLLPPGISFDFASGIAQVGTELVARLPGEPWKGRSPDTKRTKG